MENVNNTVLDLEENYLKFKNILTTNITRCDITKLIDWLDNSDAKYAPASTKYHLHVQGGLIQHCLNVYNRLYELGKANIFDDCKCASFTLESITILALLHDISKINFYTTYSRNVKDANGNWQQVTEYKVKDDAFVFGTHSENSLYMIKKFLPLTYDEELAILYHMGGYDYNDVCKTGMLFNAYRKSKLAFYLHTADMMATLFDEE